MDVRCTSPALPVPLPRPAGVPSAPPEPARPVEQALSAEIWQSLLLLGMLLAVTAGLAGVASLLLVLRG